VVGAAAAALLFRTPLLAHDFWLEPSNYHAGRGENVEIRLRVGQHFDGDAVPRNSASVLRFDARNGTVSRPVVGIDGVDPAGAVEIGADGVTLVAYVSRGSVVELTPQKLDQYAREEGLDLLRAEATKKRATNANVKDNFARSAKLIINHGSAHRGYGAVLGLPLEIVPLSDPFVAPWRPAFRVLFRGRPLANALLTAIPREGGVPLPAVRTNAAGEAVLNLGRAGEWLIKSVHIIPSALAPRADYDSFWASLTFDSRP
jgi:uncharacterized GH25 family protein